MRNIQNRTAQRLRYFLYALPINDLNRFAAGRITGLQQRIRDQLLVPEDGDVRIRVARTRREAERRPSSDITICDDGQGVAILWHDTCAIIA